jgi:hypothetical protein
MQVTLAPHEWTDHPGTLRVHSNAPGGTPDGTYDVPLSGGFVDHTPPQLPVGGPTDGAKVTAGTDLRAFFDCLDAFTGNSGTCEAVAHQDGHTVSYNGQLDTGSFGTKEWTIEGTDPAGNTAHVTLHYTVVADQQAASTVTGLTHALPGTVSGSAFESHGAPTEFKAPKPETQIAQAAIITAGGGNIITAGGGNIITAGGGNIITAGGGNIITAGGGNIITAGGGNIISAGGGNAPARRLTSSPFSTRAVAARKPKGKAIVFALAGHKFAKAGKFKTSLKLTKAGKQALDKLRKKVKSLRTHHKKAPKYLRFRVNLIVGNIQGKPRGPAYATSKWIKLKL